MPAVVALGAIAFLVARRVVGPEGTDDDVAIIATEATGLDSNVLRVAAPPPLHRGHFGTVAGGFLHADRPVQISNVEPATVRDLAVPREVAVVGFLLRIGGADRHQRGGNGQRSDGRA